MTFNPNHWINFIFNDCFILIEDKTCAITFKPQANILPPDITWEMAIL